MNVPTTKPSHNAIMTTPNTSSIFIHSFVGAISGSRLFNITQVATNPVLYAREPRPFNEIKAQFPACWQALANLRPRGSHPALLGVRLTSVLPQIFK